MFGRRHVRAQRIRALCGLSALGASFVVGVPGPGPAAATAQPVLSVGDVTVAEGDGGNVAAAFPLRLSAAAAAAVTVTVTTTDASATSSTPADFSALAPRTVTIPAGATGTNVNVTVRGDGRPEPAETFTVVLSSPSGATLGRATGTGTIIDNDPAATPALAIGDVAINEGNGGTAKATLDVTLDLPAAAAVTVPWSLTAGTATAGTDYTSASGTLTFPAGTTTRTVSVTITGDTVTEPNETFTVALGAPSGATLADGTGLVTISNDDPGAGASLRIGDATVYEGDTNNHPVTFPVRLAAAQPAAVTVQYATAPGTASGSDFTAKIGTLTIPAGAVAANITVTVVADALDDSASEQFTVALSNPTGGATIADGNGTGTIIDDDGPSAVVSIGEGAAVEGNGASATVTVPVTLSQPQPGPVTVKANTSTGTAGAADFTAVTNRTITIPAGKTAAGVTVTITGDTDAESLEQFGLTLSNPTGATIGRSGASYSIIDDDVAAGDGIQLAAGEGHSCALLSDGRVKCWGANFTAQLGLGDTANRGDQAGEMGTNLPAVDLGTGRTATQIVAGRFHTCAILDNGSVKCWGDNIVAQLGLGDTADRGDQAGEMGDSLPAVSLGTGRTATQLAAGSYHTCALLDNATVKCWGDNWSGELGQGDKMRRGDQAGEMGDNLPAVNLGAGRSVTQISSGYNHTCAILDNGTVKCWGDSTYAQLGLGLGDGFTGIYDRGDQAGEMGDNLPAVDLGTGRTATRIAAGYYSTCAQLDNGTVKCWGYNSNGQLGQGDNNTRGDAPGEMGNNLPPLDLGSGRSAVRLSVGGVRTCAILDNASVKCWGGNGFGQLGLGVAPAGITDRGNDPGEMGDNLPSVNLGTGRTARSIATGDSHTCTALDNGTVKCWGWNFYGQLGYGDGLSRGNDPSHMGNNLPAVSL